MELEFTVKFTHPTHNKSNKSKYPTHPNNTGNVHTMHREYILKYTIQATHTHTLLVYSLV